jgi:hypothetical protein
MKNIYSLVMVSLVMVSLVIIFVLSSCSDDNKNEDKGLEGTTWKCITDDDDWACTINFVDQSSFSWMETEGGGISNSISKLGGNKSSGAAKPSPRNEEKAAPQPAEIKSAKEEFAERNNEETFFASSPSDEGKNVELIFSGAKSGKNPMVKLFWDGKLVGSGTLNQGFLIKFKDPNPGAHTLKAEWSGTVATKTFNINTSTTNYYEFEYGTTGFGYAFKIK